MNKLNVYPALFRHKKAPRDSSRAGLSEATTEVIMKKEKNESKSRAVVEKSSARKASLLYDEDPATLLARFGIQVPPASKEANQKCNTQ